MDKEEIKATVRRITIDERLSEDLIRLEICELIKHDESGEFRDEPDFWEDIVGEGSGEIVTQSERPENESKKAFYIDLMSIPASQVEQFPWKDLREGQVFLSGAFEAKEEGHGDNNVTRYFIRPGKMTFMQIDVDVKENTKTLYYEVLAKEEKDGKL